MPSLGLACRRQASCRRGRIGATGLCVNIRRSVRAWLVNAAVACLSVVLTAVLLEVALRMSDGIPLLSFPNFVRERVDLLKVTTSVIYDPLLGWSLAPNLRIGSGANSLTTDAYGTRQPTSQLRTLPIGAILASGDSFTIGSEVGDRDSWPALLEKALGEPVINAGAGGWGTDQIILRAESLLDVAQPSIVIISFLWQDILRAEYRTYGGAHKPYYTIGNGVLELHNNPVPIFTGNRYEVGWTRAVFGYSYLVFWAAQRLGLTQWVNSWNLQYKLATPPGTGIDISCRLLARLKATSEQRHFGLVFLMQYGSNDFDQTAPPETARKVVDCARAAEIETVDPWAEIKQMFDRDQPRYHRLWVLEADGKTLGHMSAAGNRLMADVLLPLVRH